MYYITVDGREKLSTKYMSGYRISFSFEGFTGADIIISPMQDHISQDNIQSHLNAGALMLQCKHGRDFDGSVLSGRLSEASARMRTLEAEAYQRGLLITGNFENRGGHLYINGDRSMLTWDAYKGALNAWIIRGGAVYPIIDISELQRTIDLLASKLFVGDPFISKPTPQRKRKFVQPKTFHKGMKFSERMRMHAGADIAPTDLRHLLVNIDGLSDKTVQGIWELMKAESVSMTMGGFLSLLQSDMLLKVPGIGKATNNKIKLQLGYNDD